MEADKSAVLLEGILETLKLIYGSFETQDQRWKELEKKLDGLERDRKTASMVDAPKDRTTHQKLINKDLLPLAVRIPPLPDDGDISLSSSSELSLPTASPPEPQPEPPILDSLRAIEDSQTWAVEWGYNKGQLIHYRDWNSPLADSSLYGNQTLKRELGDAWTIPDDGRLPVKFSREYLEKLKGNILVYQISRLVSFRDQVKSDDFVDFKIVDNCAPSKDRIDRARQASTTYRLGRPAKTDGICKVSAPARPRLGDAPWRRLIFFQGLTTLLPPPDSLSWGSLRDAFLSDERHSKNWDFYHTAINDHCECKRLYSNFYVHAREKANLYNDPKRAFHITFFEILQSTWSRDKKFGQRGKWSHGPLYDGTDNKRLAESAFTMIEIPGRTASPSFHKARLRNNPTWTILVLSPPHFITRGTSTPIKMDSAMHSAALEMILKCFEKVAFGWQELSAHLENLLDERSALMRPADHDRLLWDDEGFTRSRKYFWAIHCLAEFHLSIHDNIVQWENYREARIEPLRDVPEPYGLDMDDREMVDKIEQQCNEIRVIRSYFADQLESTKALRDGLFNASGVVESRASTRLGENVKLLTFVSIFFLPIAFCTSLWSINNMFPTTTLIYTMFIVGVATYLVVFNLNNLVHQVSTAYSSIRSHLVNNMKSLERESDFWSTMGNRFGTFKPQHEKVHPSEWWIILFLFRTMGMNILRFFLRPWAPEGWKEDREEEVESIERSSSEAASSIDMSRYEPARVVQTGQEQSSPSPAADPNAAPQAGEQLVDTSRSSPVRTTNGAPSTGIAPRNAVTEQTDLDTTRTSQETRSPTPPPLMTTALPKPHPDMMAGETELITDPTTPLPPRHKRQNVARRTLSKMFRRKQTAQPVVDTEPV